MKLTRRAFLRGSISAAACAVVVTVPTFPRIWNWVDRTDSVVFGDARVAALAASMKRTKEVMSARVFNEAFGGPTGRGGLGALIAVE